MDYEHRVPFISSHIRREIWGKKVSKSTEQVASLANAYQTYKIADSNEVGDGLYTYEESLISSVINIITTVVAAVLPLSSIVVLFLVKSESTRLGILIISSACFALVLALMTNARRIEVFAATAA